MASKPLPVEFFARSYEAIQLARRKCPGKTETDKCLLEALNSAEKNLCDGLQAYKEQQGMDIEFFTSVAGFGFARHADIEKAEGILKKIVQ